MAEHPPRLRFFSSYLPRMWKKSMAQCASLLLLGGCSHITPYVAARPSPPGPERIASSQIRQRVLLIGDAGDPIPHEPVLAALHESAAEMPTKTHIVFLGDNIYPKGMPKAPKPGESPTARMDAEARIDAQLNAVPNSGVKALFLPGNHDWGKGQGEITAQAAYIGKKSRAEFLPRPGSCIAVRDLPGLRVIALDTESILLRKEHCDVHRTMNRLAEALRTAGSRQTMVVAHHPLATHGHHGDFYDWRDHVFPASRSSFRLGGVSDPETDGRLRDRIAYWVPLPFLGSIWVARQSLPSEQDVNSATYTEMRHRLLDAMAKHPPLVYAAGHDHNLQVFKRRAALSSVRGPVYQLVSGSGSKFKVTTVTDGPDTLFAYLHPGFMAVDYLHDGRVLLRVFEHRGPHNHPAVVFSEWLTRS